MGESIVHEPSVAPSEQDILKKEDKKMKKEEQNTLERETVAVHSTARTIYSFDEAVQASREYFNGDDLAAKVWTSKYALKDSYGNLYEKNPDDMHHRLASEISRIEKKYANPVSEKIIY